jgi:ABC-type multidrug transport system fused ATPase/permease subunit
MRILFTLLRRHVLRYPLRGLLLLSLALIVSALWVAEPVYTAYAVDQLIARAQGEAVNLWWLFGIWAGLFVAVSLFQALEKYAQWWFTIRLELDLYEELYERALRLPVSFHIDQKTGEAMKIVDDGSSDFASLVRIMLEIFPSLVSAIAFFVVSWHLQPTLALILLGTVVLYCLAVGLGTRHTAKLQSEANKEWVKPGGRAYDAIMNIFSVKAAGREADETQRVATSFNAVMRKQLQVNRRWALLEAINFFMLARILLIALGVLYFASGDMTLGGITFFQSSFFRVLVPFEILASALPSWSRSLSRVTMAYELTQRPSEGGDRTLATQTLPQLRGDVTLQGVSFRYEPKKPEVDAETKPVVAPTHAHPADAQGECPDCPQHAHAIPVVPEPEALPSPAITELSLQISAGEHLAVVGASGAGKSTLAQLLLRFYDVTSGSITIDGVDLRHLDLSWWRKQVGLVQQENLMFNASVLENIAYARPTATRADVEDAARRAASHDFIMALPQGYDTEIGERGVKLSGGQRQRLAIARAILKQPKLVVLDEATSALDSITERDVQRGIASLLEGRTAIVIAHRLSTVQSMDRIAVLEKGRLVACAPHDELLRTCDTYRRMVELQQGGLLSEFLDESRP